VLKPATSTSNQQPATSNQKKPVYEHVENIY